MDRRVETYKRYYEGYGEILIQLNVEDTRLGVAEYVLDRHKLDTIELKWGQGAKCIGGEIKVNRITSYNVCYTKLLRILSEAKYLTPSNRDASLCSA